MLIRFFKSSFYQQYLVLIIIAVLLWLRAYTAPCQPHETTDISPLFSLLSGLLPANAVFRLIPALILLLLEAVLLNFILIRHELLPKNSLLGALVFVVLMSQAPYVIGMNPVLGAGIFIIPAFDRIMNTYGKADPTKDVFSAAFLLALASLFYFPAVFILLLLILSFAIFGTFSVRMLFVTLAGIFAVYLYLFVYYFLFDMLEGQYWLYIGWISTFAGFKPDYDITQYIVWGMIALLTLAAILHSLSHMNEWNIKTRKKVLLIIWFMVLVLSALVYEGGMLHNTFLFLAIPLSVLISIYYANRKKAGTIMELYFMLLLLAILINNLLIAEC